MTPFFIRGEGYSEKSSRATFDPFFDQILLFFISKHDLNILKTQHPVSLIVKSKFKYLTYHEIKFLLLFISNGGI